MGHLAASDMFEDIFHPFGDWSVLRWVIFALLFIVWASYPLLYRRKFRQAEAEANEQASAAGGVSTTLQPKLGLGWIVIGVIGFLALAFMIAFPYSFSDLSWKFFDPFEERGNRTITFILILPALVIFAGLSYLMSRKPVPNPVRLVLAGTRALGLILLFFLICMPYTTKDAVAERPYRSLLVIDDSLSMGDAVREFSILSQVSLAPSLIKQLEGGEVEDRERLERLRLLVDEDRKDANRALEELQRMGLPLGEVPAIELSDVLEQDFEMRSFVRDLVLIRAARLQQKLTLLQGTKLDLKEWVEREKTIESLRQDLKSKLDEVAAEEQQENPNQPRIRVLKEEAERFRVQLQREHDAFDSSLERGVALRAAKTSDQADPQLVERVRVAVGGIVRNLLSTIDVRGPTRWDIACELTQPGNTLTLLEDADKVAAYRKVENATELPLVDLLRRHTTPQPDRLPDDIANLLKDELGNTALPAKGSENLTPGLKDLLTVYTFSSPDEQQGGVSVLRETAVEELDFMRPSGRTTQVFEAYNALLASEAHSEVVSILILSDGRDTSREGRNEENVAVQWKEALLTQRDAPVVYTVGIGHPRPERILALVNISGDDEVIKDEAVDFEIKIRANARWDVEVVLCEDTPGNEIPYDGLDGTAGKTTIVVEPGPNGEERQSTTRLRFTPKEGGVHRYWVKLNRRRLPGEDPYENNIAVHDLEVIDRKIRVLLIDQRFRYETRYLYEAMQRDKALEFQAFIFDADDGWAQPRSNYSQQVKMKMPPLVWPFCTIVNEGKPNARTKRARTKEEWFATKYDVVMIGDVELSKFSRDERKWLNQFVTQNRGGIVWLAGQHHSPHTYFDPDIQEILPVKVERGSEHGKAINIAEMKYYGRTPIGRGSDILRFADNEERQDQLWGSTRPGGVFEAGQLDGFYWHAKVAGPKDDLCAVLARVAYDGDKLTFFGQDEKELSDPLIVSREFESGRSLFIGTDEMWRMRRYFGDLYTYRFWQNVVRWAATSKLKAKKQDIDLDTDQKRYVLGQPSYVYCELIGADDVGMYKQISARQENEVKKLVETSPDLKAENLLLVEWKNASAGLTSGLSSDLEKGVLVLKKVEGRRNFFEGRFFPNSIGKYEVNILNEPATTKNPHIFFVQASTEQMRELRETSLNADLLRGLASDEKVESEGSTSADGELVEVDGTLYRPHYSPFYEIAKLHPDLRTKTVIKGTEERDAFNLLELLVALTCLFAAEWFIRKLVRLA